MPDAYGPKVTSYIKRIKLLLGHPILKIEISDEDIAETISMALDKIKPYATDISFITKPFSSKIFLGDDHVLEVLRVLPGSQVISQSIGDEIMFDFQVYKKSDDGRLRDAEALVRRAVTPDVFIPFNYDADSQICYISPGYVTGNVSLEVAKDILSLETLRDDRAQTWIFSYSLALCKEILGRIRSKVKSSNIPIEFDGDTLLNEASTEKSNLEASLVSEQFGPIPILR